jgi:hypothetical protein
MITVFILFILFSLLIWKWSFIKKLPFNFLIRYLLFLLKVIAGAAFFYVYTYYYSDDRRLKSDLWKYYEDAAVIYDMAKQGDVSLFFRVMVGSEDKEVSEIMHQRTEFWYKSFNYGLYNENRTIIRFIVVAMFLTGKNIYALSLLAVFLSYLGWIAIYIFFYRHLGDKYRWILLVAIFLIPSVVFWTSALLKEMLVVLFLGFGLYFLDEKKYLLSALFFVLSLFTKIYIALPVLPALLSYYLAKRYGVLKAYGVVYSVVIIAVLILHFAGSGSDLLLKLSQKQHDFITMAKAYGAGSLIELKNLDNNLLNFIKLFPMALFNSFFRPFIFDYTSVIVLPNIFENILLIVYVLFVLYKFKKVDNKEILNISMFALIYSFTVFLIIGYTVPVLGALVRYRAPLLPFFVVGLSVFCNCNYMFKSRINRS